MENLEQFFMGAKPLNPKAQIQMWGEGVEKQGGSCKDRNIRVRKTQHQNPEFGPKPGEIQKRTCKKEH
jgi:hypothetical protein